MPTDRPTNTFRRHRFDGVSHESASAIDMQHLAIHIAVREEEDDGLGDLARLADPPSRERRGNSGQNGGPRCHSQHIEEWGFDEAGRYDIDPDRFELERQRRRQGFHAAHRSRHDSYAVTARSIGELPSSQDDRSGGWHRRQGGLDRIDRTGDPFADCRQRRVGIGFGKLSATKAAGRDDQMIDDGDIGEDLLDRCTIDDVGDTYLPLRTRTFLQFMAARIAALPGFERAA